MSGLLYSADSLRAMYPGGRADVTARRLSRLWARVFAAGLMPRRWVTLEVAGRRSGRPTRFPLGMADWNGQWYLVPFLGEECNWVKNVRAAGGLATLRRHRAVPVRLVELPVSERAPVIRRYLQKVPGGRPHIPVGRHAPAADFEAIAPRYPVFRVDPRPGARGARRAPRRRHWGRWLLAGVAGLVALVFAGAALFVELQPSPAPLALPVARAGAPAGPAGGTWAASPGSVAGFRVRETALGFSNDTVGRTSAVTGTLVIAGDQVTRAVFRVDLAAVTVGGKVQAQFARSLGTRAHPSATVTLARPVTLGPGFAAGATITATAPGYLAMNGATHRVTIAFSGRRDGAALQVAGSIPVAFAEWGIRGPQNFGFIASLADHGVAEFFVVLRRA
ncbi:MAG TPA: YceI family protein [Streptosporangiaceae bacterium]|nr:YceI family protein [Streptosporangiaceae bacterium]